MQARFDVRPMDEDGYAVWLLEDAAARSRVWVCPALGLNAYRFTVPLGGRAQDIIESPPRLTEIAARPSAYGLPILFPFPGRIRSGRFRFGDREYLLSHKNPSGHASHGFVLDRPWQIVTSGAEGGAVLLGRIESRTFPELASQYPSAFRLDVRYCLHGWRLTVEACAQNIGSEALPVGYGLHPYLRAPIADSSTAALCTVRVPAVLQWELVEMLPTGRLLPADPALAAGLPLAGRRLDDVFTASVSSPGGSSCALIDAGSGARVAVEAEGDLRHWVVYTPPRPAVCFEPYTCVPDALNLQPQGIEAGLIVLQPGEMRRWVARVVVQTQSDLGGE